MGQVYDVAQRAAAASGGGAVKTKAKISESLERLHVAQQAVKDAENEHRLAFRRALVDLCNEYGFCLEACGTEGARIELLEVRAGSEVKLEDIPE